MKNLTALLVTTALLTSTSAFAKIKYIDGTVSAINKAENTISIVGDVSGETKVYRFSHNARVDFVSAGTQIGSTRDVSSLNKGESVRLKLK